jgi:type IV fimbrial biogenesis protein FimT
MNTPAAAPSRKRGMNGLTLVECLVALTIVSIVSGLGYMTMARLIPAAHLGHATRSLVSLCRHARIEAVKTNSRMRLTCDSVANVCRLSAKDDGRLIAHVDFSQMGHGISLGSSLDTSFTGRGRATRAGTVPVRNAAGETRSVVVRLSGGVVTR